MLSTTGEERATIATPSSFDRADSDRLESDDRRSSELDGAVTLTLTLTRPGPAGTGGVTSMAEAGSSRNDARLARKGSNAASSEGEGDGSRADDMHSNWKAV